MGVIEGFYRRKLPHWQPERTTLFVTWRLHGSLPASVALGRSVQSGREFVQIDRQMDAAATGPVWLKEPRIAGGLLDALHFAERALQLCDLQAWVVMSNHVHVVLAPHVPLWRITKAIKGFSARQANRILGRTGQPFWQRESFDRWIRNRRELERTVRYVEGNPVSAGLVKDPADWPWSSAGATLADPAGRLDTTGVVSHDGGCS